MVIARYNLQLWWCAIDNRWFRFRCISSFPCVVQLQYLRNSWWMVYSSSFDKQTKHTWQTSETIFLLDQHKFWSSKANILISKNDCCNVYFQLLQWVTGPKFQKSSSRFVYNSSFPPPQHFLHLLYFIIVHVELRQKTKWLFPP